MWLLRTLRLTIGVKVTYIVKATFEKLKVKEKRVAFRNSNVSG